MRPRAPIRLVLLGCILLTPVLSHAWQTTLAGTPPASRPFAVTADGQGDVLTVGRATIGPTDDDALLVKLSGGNGDESWRRMLAGTAGGNDVLRAVAIDAANGVFAAGQLANTTTGGDAVITKHDEDGTQAWRIELDGGAQGEDDALAVAVAASGDAIVAGQLTPMGASTTRFSVLRLQASDGMTLWRMDLAGESGSARAVAVDGSDVVAAGDAGDHIVVARLAGGNGMELWRTDVTGIVDAADVGRALAVGGGRVVVAGHVVTQAGGQDFAVVALDAATGAEAWRHVIDGTATADADVDDAFGVTVDAAGDVIAAGRLSNTDTDDDLVVVKLTAATGAELWRRTVNGGNDNDDLAQAMAVDAVGDVFVTGTIRNPGSRADFLLAKLSGATGAERWRHVLDGSKSAADSGLAVATTPGNDVVGAGRLRNGDTADGYVVIERTGENGGDFPCANGEPDAGEGCDDGNVEAGDGCRADCTVEACGDGILDPQEACEDGNTTAGDCCSVTCSREPDGSPCDDANACTLGDACQQGACVFANSVPCVAASPCHNAACDPMDGSCSSAPKADGAICDDANACTVLDQCVATVCTGSIIVVCNDADPCTADRCDPAIGCTGDALTGFPSLGCVFERDTIPAGCPAGVPTPIGRRIDTARRLVERGNATDRRRRARTALTGATKAIKCAMRLTARELRREQLDAGCAAALDEVLGELLARAGALRATLRR